VRPSNWLERSADCIANRLGRPVFEGLVARQLSFPGQIYDRLYPNEAVAMIFKLSSYLRCLCIQSIELILHHHQLSDARG
jgi:hypothetical protein